MRQMRALYFASHGDTGNLLTGELPDPHPQPGEVTVAVQAAALNHLDLFVLRGLPGLNLELPHIGGADGAGRIAEVGRGVPGWNVGDEVVFNPGLWCGECEFCRRGEESLCIHYGLIGEHRKGTLAGLVRVPAVALAPRPAHLDWVEAAAFPLTFLTAWRMLVTRARLRSGETVLIHGIGGGVALAALLIAKHLGATAFVTSSADEKLARASALGADATINYTRTDVAREVRSLTGRRGVDVTVETVGEATWLTSLRSTAKGGRIVTCGATSGPNPNEEIRLVFWNQLSILGSTMGSAADWRAMVEAFAEWGLHPVVDSVHPLESARQAYERLEHGVQFGKIVVAVHPDLTAVEEPQRV
jgi:NADPH:quinone reductase-like Zn-dependent oxidoreductase